MPTRADLRWQDATVPFDDRERTTSHEEPGTERLHGRHDYLAAAINLRLVLKSLIDDA